MLNYELLLIVGSYLHFEDIRKLYASFVSTQNDIKYGWKYWVKRNIFHSLVIEKDVFEVKTTPLSILEDKSKNGKNKITQIEMLEKIPIVGTIKIPRKKGIWRTIWIENKRRGRYIFYDGPYDGEELYETYIINKEEVTHVTKDTQQVGLILYFNRFGLLIN